MNVNSYGADVGQNSLIISNRPSYVQKISKVPLIIAQTGKNAGAGLLERLRPLAWGTRSSFQERFPSVAQIRKNYADPAFVSNCNDFDEPQYPERAMHVAAESRRI